MEVLRHFHPFLPFPARGGYLEKRGRAVEKALLRVRAERDLPASSILCWGGGNVGRAFRCFGRTLLSPWGERSCPGVKSSGLERMSAFSGKISQCRTSAVSAAQAQAVPQVKSDSFGPGSAFEQPERKRFIFVHPAPSALWTGPDEDLFNTGTAFAPQFGARRRQRPGADFGRVNHSPQHGRNPCSCIIP